MADYWWFIKKLLHIETLFAIFVICTIIYFIFSKDKKSIEEKIGSFLRTVNDVNEPSSIKASSKKNKKLFKHEEKCRQIFEGIFDAQFPSVRPDWLKNPITGQNLELDGFNPNIKTRLGKGLAFEYDGEQHAKYSPHFHRGDPKKFVYQYKKDSYKDQCCKRKGVLLIRIPHYIHHSELDMYIVKKLENNGLV